MFGPHYERSHYRLGLRCEALVILGGMWILQGLGVFMRVPHFPHGSLLMLIPPQVRIAAWAATGLFAILAGAFSHRTSEALGGLMLMPMMRAVSYLLSWVLFLIPGDQSWISVEDPFGWFDAVFYLGLIACVMVVSRIPPGMERTIGPSWDERHEHERLERET